jgi:CelD/BcsL family acetyltransferase involved in cellulose biosynthesis
MLAGQRLQAFHREVASGFEKLGILRLYRLVLNEKPAAVIYAFTHRKHTYAYLSGFDPALSKLSPGTVLLAHVVEQAIAEGVHTFDFLRNPEPYKYKWAATDQPTYKLNLTKPAPDRSSPGLDPDR